MQWNLPYEYDNVNVRTLNSFAYNNSENMRICSGFSINFMRLFFILLSKRFKYTSVRHN